MFLLEGFKIKIFNASNAYNADPKNTRTTSRIEELITFNVVFVFIHPVGRDLDFELVETFNPVKLHAKTPWVEL